MAATSRLPRQELQICARHCGNWSPAFSLSLITLGLEDWVSQNPLRDRRGSDNQRKPQLVPRFELGSYLQLSTLAKKRQRPTCDSSVKEKRPWVPDTPNRYISLSQCVFLRLSRIQRIRFFKRVSTFGIIKQGCWRFYEKPLRNFRLTFFYPWKQAPQQSLKYLWERFRIVTVLCFVLRKKDQIAELSHLSQFVIST